MLSGAAMRTTIAQPTKRWVVLFAENMKRAGFSEAPEQPQNRGDTYRRKQFSHPAGTHRFKPRALEFPRRPALLDIGVDDVHHDRDRPLATSSERVGSGASHNQWPTAAGIIARLAMMTQNSGLSRVRSTPAVMTVATHDANTRNFR